MWQTSLELLVFVPQPALTAYRHDAERLPHASHSEGLLAGVLAFACVLESVVVQVAASRAERRDESGREPEIALDAEQGQQLRALVHEHGILEGGATPRLEVVRCSESLAARGGRGRGMNGSRAPRARGA